MEKIEEKEIERISKQFTEKGFTEGFYGRGIQSDDIKAWLDEFVAKLPAQHQAEQIFPVIMFTYIEGAPPHYPYKACVFNLDYDQLGGLHVKSLHLIDHQAHGFTTNQLIDRPLAIADLPTKAALQAHPFELRTGMDAAHYHITPEQIQKFVRQIEEKGYTHGFTHLPKFEKADLITILTQHLKDPGHQQMISKAFPLTVGTITGQSEIKKMQTQVIFGINHDPHMGLNLTAVKIISKSMKAYSIDQNKQLVIKSTADLPSVKEVNKIAETLASPKKGFRL
ncbi:hypothetical protein [Chitinophaga sp. Ak27]|uniref:hypothetical protein n=1 Tax=Chitinophaga sp. Ak27 TaxID=2726116 RepID=UPI00145E07F2|nr:hypothetical protein [Chitinophaga sp. Ak27]NLU94848.1 hypothetical protein [Chitinophaga sp. Ak27]